MLQTLQMIRSLKLCRISSINSSVWNEMCSIKPCISLSLSLSCKQVTDHRVEGTTHTAMFQSSSPCTFRNGERTEGCELSIESVELLRLHSLHVWFEIWKSYGSRFVSSESSKWDASRSCFLGYILRSQHISSPDFHLTRKQSAWTHWKHQRKCVYRCRFLVPDGWDWIPAWIIKGFWCINIVGPTEDDLGRTKEILEASIGKQTGSFILKGWNTCDLKRSLCKQERELHGSRNKILFEVISAFLIF